MVVAQHRRLPRRRHPGEGGLGQRVELGGEVGRRRAAGRGRQVPFDDQPRLAQHQRHVVGRRRPADVGARRRPALQVGEEVDRGAVEPRLALRLAGAEDGEEVVAEVLEQDQAAPAVGAEHLGRAEAAGAQPGGDREEGPDVEAALRRHVHQDGAGEPPAAPEPLVAPRRGVARQRLAFGPAPAFLGEELADLGRAGHAAAASASAAGSQSQPDPCASSRARRRCSPPDGMRGRASAGGAAAPARAGPPIRRGRSRWRRPPRGRARRSRRRRRAGRGRRARARPARGRRSARACSSARGSPRCGRAPPAGRRSGRARSGSCRRRARRSGPACHRRRDAGRGRGRAARWRPHPRASGLNPIPCRSARRDCPAVLQARFASARAARRGLGSVVMLGARCPRWRRSAGRAAGRRRACRGPPRRPA